ncbi:MAG TPA: phosphoglucomutase/phosphomannomutase family protein [Candidatus Goldiibacteriota bacterium]|nr:phosphoglucomutase/phosphomannomutase family protein [Candidatus Goldiibacteriota bacterium]
MSEKIKFGTSGWRGIISDDFTFHNVKTVCQAIADFIKSKRSEKGKPVIIGGDARFLSDKFCAAAAEVMAGNGIKALVCDRDTPTPVIAYEIIRRKAAGGINFTASHNPPEYNGLKFSPSWGGPATPAETSVIESNIRKVKVVKTVGMDEGQKRGLIQVFDPSPFYLKRIKEIVDFSVIKSSRMKVVADPLFSTGRGYLDRLLKEAGANVTVINDRKDVLFGGFPPEPAEKNVADLIAAVKREKAVLGVATDGDADRYGIIDSDGSYIPANKILPLLLDYLVETRPKWKGAAVRSVATSGMLDAVARLHGIKLYETPVGFKYIGDIMTREDIIIGGEESNGLTVYRHVPEKDGIIACLLVVEMAARKKKNIRTLLSELEKKTGAFYNARKNFRLTEDRKRKLIEKLSDFKFGRMGKYEVKDLIKVDGFKFVLGEDTWVMTRLSGTEPIVRLYAEAKSRKELDEILEAGEAFIMK